MTIISNGRIVTSDKTYLSDLLLRNGIIEKIGTLLESDYESAEEIIDASGKYILPGGIDVHTHLDLNTGTINTSDDFNSGSRAAIAGGTTMFIDFATQDRDGSLKDAVSVWDEKAKKGVFCDYSYHMAITKWNENTKKEMKNMVDLGITSFKMYMAYKNTLQVDDGVIYEALKEAKNIGGLIGFHCENGDLIETITRDLLSENKKTPYYHQISRPEIIEEEAIFRLGEIARLTNTYFWLVHLSSKEGGKIVEEIRDRGTKVLVETCPHYLVLDNSVYKDEDNIDFETAKYVLSPPIRDIKSQNYLKKMIQEKKINLISTDHCSFNFRGQKELGREDFSKIPNGAPGIEHRISLIYTYMVCEGIITINDMVRLLCENPARYFGITNKGRVKEGYDGDLVVFNPEKDGIISSKDQFQNVDYTPYEGFLKKGEIETVFLRGEKIFDKGNFVKADPTGRFVKREKFEENILI